MIHPRGEVVRATEDEVARFYGAIEFQGKWVAKAIRKGRLVAGIGGLIETEDGVWWAFFEVPKHERKPSVLRHIKAAFDEAKANGARVIRAVCDSRIEGAERLMRHLDFQPTDEKINDETVWECPVLS